MHGRLTSHTGAEFYCINVSGEAQAGSALSTETLGDGKVVTKGWSRQNIDVLVRQAQGSTATHNVTNKSLGLAFFTRNRELCGLRSTAPFTWPVCAVHGALDLEERARYRVTDAVGQRPLLGRWRWARFHARVRQAGNGPSGRDGADAGGRSSSRVEGLAR